MWLTSKIQQLITVLKPGVVTLPYPQGGGRPPETLRGAPHWDHNKCVGCGGCANHCSARAILIRDVCQELRILVYEGSRCTYCGRCAEVCPEQAISMTNRFEQATDDPADLNERLELYMMTCKRCGRCYDLETANVLDRLSIRGYRYDDLETRSLIPRASDQLDLGLLAETESFERPREVKK